MSDIVLVDESSYVGFSVERLRVRNFPNHNWGKPNRAFNFCSIKLSVLLQEQEQKQKQEQEQEQ